MRIASLGTALPQRSFAQADVFATLSSIWKRGPAFGARTRQLFENVRVDRRHFVRPLEDYLGFETFGQTNDVWIEEAMALGEQAIDDALSRVGLGPQDIDALFVTSVTGICSPSLDARLFNRMGMRPDLKRIPLFGLGCVAGVSGVARAADYVRAFPDQIAVLLSVELCSLTFQRKDLSIANIIATALFGDGAAAVVVVGAERARRLNCDGPRILGSRSTLYPETEDLMGWHIGEGGFGLILSEGVPGIARERLGPDVDRFLEDRALTREDIGAWICHPGGPKVLRAMQESLALDDSDVAFSWDALREQGNLSSASVLMVLRRVLDQPRPPEGTRGLMLAMGPAFCSEIVLIQW